MLEGGAELDDGARQFVILEAAEGFELGADGKLELEADCVELDPVIRPSCSGGTVFT